MRRTQIHCRRKISSPTSRSVPAAREKNLTICCSLFKPPNIILVHGEPTEMARLANDLRKSYQHWEERPKVRTPRNCEVRPTFPSRPCFRLSVSSPLQEVVLEFKAEKTAKAIGSLAKTSQQDGQDVSGVIVSQGFHNHLLAPEDIPTYTQLSTSSVSQIQHVPFQQDFSVLVSRLASIYEALEEVGS